MVKIADTYFASLCAFELNVFVTRAVRGKNLSDGPRTMSIWHCQNPYQFSKNIIHKYRISNNINRFLGNKVTGEILLQLDELLLGKTFIEIWFTFQYSLNRDILKY